MTETRRDVIRDAVWDHKPALLESQADEAADVIEAALVAYEDAHLVAIARAIHGEYYPGTGWVPEHGLAEEETALEAARVVLCVLRAARGVPTEEA